MKNAEIERIPFYIEMGKDVLLAWCHLPEHPTDHAVVICPPVGHEFVNSYRGLRHLADGFAEKGVTTFRMEYQGVGDSSGLDTDPDRLQKWLDSIEQVVKFIKEKCNIQKISLLGLRMGATLASMISNKIEIENLMCWVPVVEGRRYIREMLALQKTGENADLDVDSTTLEGGGFLITRETMNELLSISLAKIIPNAKHVFLFNTDDLPIPNQLIETWSNQNFQFEHKTLSGYAEMMATPHNSKVPHYAIEEITSIKIEGNTLDINIFNELKNYQQTRFDCYTYGSTAKESTDAGGFPITEILCQNPNAPLFGIFSLPLLRDAESKPTVLLLNAGSVHRMGPNRNYVYITRELLSLGYKVFRLDFLGLGDSINPNLDKENDPYMPEALDNIQCTIDYLKMNHNTNEIILIGVCSGAYSAFQFALQREHESVHEILPINPLTFYWKEGMSLDYSPADYYFDWNSYQESMRRKDRWMKLLKDPKRWGVTAKTTINVLYIKLAAFLKPFVNQVKRILGAKNIEDLAWDLNVIVRKKMKVKFIFADTDPGYQLLKEGAGKTVNKLLNQKKIRIEFIPKSNHNFSSHLGRTQLLKRLKEHFSDK
ncbi:MAG: alpha/beta hydrolase [Anaerolineales bacterium]|nr:alpha/beta hydrolase [Anaerolineales bacterium]